MDRGLCSAMSTSARAAPIARRLSARTEAMILPIAIASICQDDVEECRIEEIPAREGRGVSGLVERLQSLAGNERRARQPQHDVLRVERAISQGDREIVADLVGDVRLVPQQLERR